MPWPSTHRWTSTRGWRRARRMHGTTLARTQRRTRARCSRCGWLSRTRALEDRLATHGQSRAAGRRICGWRWRRIHRARASLRNNHAARRYYRGGMLGRSCSSRRSHWSRSLRGNRRSSRSSRVYGGLAFRHQISRSLGLCGSRRYNRCGSGLHGRNRRGGHWSRGRNHHGLRRRRGGTAAWRDCATDSGVTMRGAGAAGGGVAGAAGFTTTAGLFTIAFGGAAGTTAGLATAGGASAWSLRARIAFSASPGLLIFDRSIFGRNSSPPALLRLTCRPSRGSICGPSPPHPLPPSWSASSFP